MSATMIQARKTRPVGAPVVLFAFWLAASIVMTAATTVNRDLDLAMFGSLACLAVTAPTLLPQYRWVSPWALVLLVVYIGCGLRGFVVVSHGLDSPMIQRMYVRGLDAGAMDRGGWVVVGGLALLALGYSVVAYRTLPARQPSHYEFGQLFRPVIWACVLVSLYAFWRYAQSTGGLDLTNLSAKRAVYVPGQQYSGGAGVWRSLNELGAVALYVAIARHGYMQRGAGSLPGRARLALALLAANAVLLPVYSSTRGQVIFTLLTAMVIYAVCRGSIRWRSVAMLALAGTALLSALTLLRQDAQGARVDYSPEGLASGLSDAIALNLNFVEVPKTAQIVAAVPERLAYSNGSTISNYAVAWVPRSLWPEKPVIDAGVRVGVELYRTDGTAIPPGLLAELYWASGWPAVVLGAVAFGLLIGLAERRLLSRSYDSPAVAVIYGTAVFDLGANALSSSMGYAITSALLSGATAAVILALIGRGSGVTEELSPTKSPQPGRYRQPQS